MRPLFNVSPAPPVPRFCAERFGFDRLVAAPRNGWRREPPEIPVLTRWRSSLAAQTESLKYAVVGKRPIRHGGVESDGQCTVRRRHATPWAALWKGSTESSCPRQNQVHRHQQSFGVPQWRGRCHVGRSPTVRSCSSGCRPGSNPEPEHPCERKGPLQGTSRSGGSRW